MSEYIKKGDLVKWAGRATTVYSDVHLTEVPTYYAIPIEDILREIDEGILGLLKKKSERNDLLWADMIQVAIDSFSRMKDWAEEQRK